MGIHTLFSASIINHLLFKRHEYNCEILPVCRLAYCFFFSVPLNVPLLFNKMLLLLCTLDFFKILTFLPPALL